MVRGKPSVRCWACIGNHDPPPSATFARGRIGFTFSQWIRCTESPVLQAGP